MVDNRYSGIGYEPPFETPSDKDFMAAHIEELQQRLATAEAECAIYYEIAAAAIGEEQTIALRDAAMRRRRDKR